jgi:hypothetical protein
VPRPGCPAVQSLGLSSQWPWAGPGEGTAEASQPHRGPCIFVELEVGLHQPSASDSWEGVQGGRGAHLPSDGWPVRTITPHQRLDKGEAKAGEGRRLQGPRGRGPKTVAVAVD